METAVCRPAASRASALPAWESLLTNSTIAINAAVGTIAISRKKSARRRPKLTLRQRILGPRLAQHHRLRAGTNIRPTPRGAIAQLGERLDRTQEVAGSSPASSISGTPVGRGGFCVTGWLTTAAAIGERRHQGSDQCV